MRGRVDRGEIFLEYTKSICPVCKRVIDAEVNVREQRVVMRKRCRDHGVFEALVYSDAELYLSQARFNKPGTLPLQFQTEVRDGCPLDCGLCPEHKQHTCLALIEVNTACNLDCPICFADSGHHRDGYSLTREQVAFMIDRFVEAEGEPEVLQLSGGEPTLHPEIIDFVRMAKARGVRVVMLNTNGIRLARDGRFVEEVARAGAHVYLQFDGLDKSARTGRSAAGICGRTRNGPSTRAPRLGSPWRLSPPSSTGSTSRRWERSSAWACPTRPWFSASATVGAEQALLACESCGVDLPAALADLREHVFLVTVQDFQDPYTLNVRQLVKCCVAQITPDGRFIPFCAYNSVGYREQVRAALSSVPVAPVVPNARPLLPLLEPTPYGSMTVAANGPGATPRDATNVGRRLAW